jgi:hypothetical protein
LLAYVGVLAVFVWHAGSVLGELRRPLAISSLLYADPTPKAGREPIEQALLQGATKDLDGMFESLLMAIVAASILTYLAWRIAQPSRLRSWLVAPFFIVLGLYLLLMPMAYGVMQRPIRYPRVVLTMGDGSAIGGQPQTNASLFLMNKGDDAFIVWERTTRRLIWVPTNSVRRAEVSAVEALFPDPKAVPSDPGGGP